MTTFKQPEYKFQSTEAERMAGFHTEPNLTEETCSPETWELLGGASPIDKSSPEYLRRKAEFDAALGLK